MSDDFDFDLVTNGLDYLTSAAEHAKNVDARSCKYALLHLVAGVELVIKARLELEHWSLLFADVDKSDEQALRSGEFKSADFEAAFKRLENVCRVSIDRSVRLHLDELRKLRNRVQHFGARIAVEQIRALLATGLNFTVDFCNDELQSQLRPEHHEALKGLHAHLVDFTEYVDVRLDSIKDRLEGVPMVYVCPRCEQEAVKITQDERYCFFCNSDPDPAELSEWNGEGPQDGTCLRCGQSFLCFVLYNNEEGGAHCTSCGFAQSICLSCFRFFVGDGDYCDACSSLPNVRPANLPSG